MKMILVALALLIVMIFVYLSIPQAWNANPSYQKDLVQGKSVSQDVKDILTPTEKPKRDRSIMVLQDEQVVYEYGPTEKVMNGHSTRKAFLGLLYGIAIEKGLIDIHKSLAELEIDEYTALTDQEKTATIRDLLMWRSGIYLPAAGEHDSQITDRPKRGSHKPGEYFFSNNFDSNALGTIFVQETGYSIGSFMEEFLAKPLGMQDFDKDNVVMGAPWFWPSKKTQHKMYYMYLSTRDFAKIGAMVANGGKWNGKQVVPADWIEESTFPHSSLKGNHIDYGRYDAFGYLWWIDQDTGTIWTDGYGGHFMLIDPERNLTIVERNFTGNSPLSTGLWLWKKNREMNLFRLIEAHKKMVEEEGKG